MNTLKLRDYTGRTLSEYTILKLYNTALALAQDACRDRGYSSEKKKVYYISVEFLIGKLLSSSLISFGIYDDMKAKLAEAGEDITELEEFEYEPSLGNGGLGGLVACFIDSLATLSPPADGVGLTYHCGLFRQPFEDRKQHMRPDYWRKWGTANWVRRTGRHYKVQCDDLGLLSTMYEIDVTGYGSKYEHLCLFDLGMVSEGLIGSDIGFDKKEIEKNLTLFLYPDDSDEDGKLLRVYQEYFAVNNTAQLILGGCVGRGSDLHNLADYAAIQINDTHPSLVIPELVRLLTERGIEEKEAYQIVADVCTYTNHTVFTKTLETQPKHFFKAVVPRLMPIIKRMNDAVKTKYEEPSVQITDKYDDVHMVHMDIHYSHSVNDVAKLHTDILKETELNNFYKLYPEKFNNKINGTTFCRWVIKCNPELTELIAGKIGEDWKMDAKQLEQLIPYTEDETFLQCILNRENTKKHKLSARAEQYQGGEVDLESIYDMQIERLHEYKRQRLDLLWVVDRYLHIKDGYRPGRPVTVFFGTEAAPAYVIAKDIVYVTLVSSSVMNNDPEVNPYLKVVMLRNYNVSMAEKLIPTSDIFEQISLASKEASGTDNMKFMLSGAVTLGTMDRANVEIAELVGEDNIFTFGQSSEEVIECYKSTDYIAENWYKKDKRLATAVGFLVSEGMLEAGGRKLFKQLYDGLLGKDWFMTLSDFESYCKTKDKALVAYEDRMDWAKKMAVNIARTSYFSSDKTIDQYSNNI